MPTYKIKLCPLLAGEKNSQFIDVNLDLNHTIEDLKIVLSFSIGENDPKVSTHFCDKFGCRVGFFFNLQKIWIYSNNTRLENHNMACNMKSVSPNYDFRAKRRRVRTKNCCTIF